MSQVQGLNTRLDAMIAAESKAPERDPRLVRVGYHLMLDGGRLRLINDTDRSLEPNKYLSIIYEKDYQRRTWRIYMLDNQNKERQVAEYVGK